MIGKDLSSFTVPQLEGANRFLEDVFDQVMEDRWLVADQLEWWNQFLDYCNTPSWRHK